jgi:hypothetical protein
MTKWIWKLHNQKGRLWVRLLTTKYMPNGVFSYQKWDMGLNFGRAYTKSNTCSSGGLSIELAMAKSLSFGMMSG